MIKYALSILFLSYILCTSNEMKKLSVKDITKYHKTDTTLLMMYLNPLNFTHKAMLDNFHTQITLMDMLMLLVIKISFISLS